MNNNNWAKILCLLSFILFSTYIIIDLYKTKNELEKEDKKFQTLIEKVGEVNTLNAHAEIFEIKRKDYSCVFLVQNQSFTTFQCMR